jgi:excisionase family DNA binding protein
MDRDTTAPEFLTTREVAALLRVKERKVYDLASAGQIPCRRITGKLLFQGRDRILAHGRALRPGKDRTRA